MTFHPRGQNTTRFTPGKWFTSWCHLRSFSFPKCSSRKVHYWLAIIYFDESGDGVCPRRRRNRFGVSEQYVQFIMDMYKNVSDKIKCTSLCYSKYTMAAYTSHSHCSLISLLTFSHMHELLLSVLFTDESKESQSFRKCLANGRTFLKTIG